MGSCYSCRSRDGCKYSNDMAAVGKESPKTKRATPYCRGTMSTFGFKRRSPSSVKSLSKTSELVNHYESRIASLNDSNANISRTTNAIRNTAGQPKQSSQITRFGFKRTGAVTNTALHSDANSNILSDTNTVRQRTTPVDHRTNTKTSFENTRIAQPHVKNPVNESGDHKVSRVSDLRRPKSTVTDPGKSSRTLRLPVRTSETHIITPKGSPKRFSDRLPQRLDITPKCRKDKNSTENLNSSKENVSQRKSEQAAPIAQTELFEDEQMQTSTDSIPDENCVTKEKLKKYVTNKFLEDTKPLLVNENSREQTKLEDYDSGNEHDDDTHDNTLIADSDNLFNLNSATLVVDNSLSDVINSKSDKTVNISEVNSVIVSELKDNFSKCEKPPTKIQQVFVDILNRMTLNEKSMQNPSDENVEVLRPDKLCDKLLHVETEFPNSISDSLIHEMKLNDENGEFSKASKIKTNLSSKLPNEKKDDLNGGDILSPTGSLNKGTFLIDDDYTDQPALITNGHFTQHLEDRTFIDKDEDAGFLDRSDDTQSQSDSYSARRTPMLGKISMGKSNDTLSPCSSLDSEDLMLDFEKSLEEDYVEHCVDRSYDQPAEGAGEITFQAEDRTSPDGEIDRQADMRPIQTSNTFLEWASLINNHQTHSSKLKPHYDRNLRIRSISTPESPNQTEFRPRSMTALKPPKQISAIEEQDGGVTIDSSSYRYFLQDLTIIKTMLHKLKRILHEAETVNPFEASLSLKNGLYKSLASCESPNSFLKCPEIDKEIGTEDIIQENADLRRQVVFLQQKLEDQDHTIKLLQQQMVKYNQIPESEEEKERSNAATQTDKPRILGGSNISRSPSVEDAGSCSIKYRTELSSENSPVFEELCLWTSQSAHQAKPLSHSLNSIYHQLKCVGSSTQSCSLQRSRSVDDGLVSLT